MPPGIGTGSVFANDRVAPATLVSSAAEETACWRCSAKSFRTSNLVCAWVVEAKRASIAHRQATKAAMRGTGQTPPRCGDGPTGRICIATSLMFGFPWNRPANKSRMPRVGTLSEGKNLAQHCAPVETPRQPKSCGQRTTKVAFLALSPSFNGMNARASEGPGSCGEIQSFSVSSPSRSLRQRRRAQYADARAGERKGPTGGK